MSEPIEQALSDNGVLRLTLNNPQRRNALSMSMIAALHDAIKQADVSTAVKVIVLGANGPAFSAGHDLKEITAAREQPDKGRAFFSTLMGQCAAMMTDIVTCSKPVIAEVDGIATAAGCQLVASCDLAYASDTSRFATPGVNIGLFCSTPMVALSRNVANKHAMEMLLTGDMFSACDAERIGLINRVTDSESLKTLTHDIASKIAEKSSMTLAIGKAAFYRQKDMDLVQAYAYSAEVMVDNMLTKDGEEGITAFVEKRPPVWRNE
ncbi:enoyl-CoA hydratase [Enterovibrio sp. ZSDZ35]|uniref:Enoyl-CoA hydratase domain-containing protein 3, mitochondrial n=1 Tax=Enterovibrio qingdaonensis TaxID=2899818 RepID=A0ABT5QKZ9_9GAMM|nr:enoyl-CoA hydratase [Enterovibrio sp. ZSDZ35]MDD1781657.1 enoyl-CoA hydratase [Enterovibrio sp. ZSDZ35]